MSTPYFEDVETGETWEFDERYEVTEAEVVDFGRRYEPWVQHVDPESAHESGYVKRLTAGTMHVCAMGTRLLYDGTLADSGAVDTVAVEDAWREYQVHPGDALGIRAEAVGTETLSDRLGLVEFEVSVFEADDVTVATMTVVVAYLRRDAD